LYIRADSDLKVFVSVSQGGRPHADGPEFLPSAMPTLSDSKSRWMAHAFLVCALIWFAGLEYRGLAMPDEGRYADIAREMLDGNDWVTPRLNGLKYFEKPPLQYWATAGAFAAFGVDEWTARLWPAVTGFLCLAFTAFAALRLAPGSPWIPTALIFAGCWGYFLGGQFLTLDMGLTFFLTAAMLSFALSRRAGLSPPEERNWMLLAWAAAACAVLSKGLVGVVIPGLVLAVHLAIDRDLSLLRRLHWIPGLCLFAAIVLPWFVLVQHRNPEFFHFFFVHEHFERYALSDHHRPGPWWYFIPVVLVGLWTASSSTGFSRSGRRSSSCSSAPRSRSCRAMCCPRCRRSCFSSLGIIRRCRIACAPRRRSPALRAASPSRFSPPRFRT
jgi:4-amino-4-deoxy-L-arabinose transferase-like glycosyltransferase